MWTIYIRINLIVHVTLVSARRNAVCLGQDIIIIISAIVLHSHSGVCSEALCNGT